MPHTATLRKIAILKASKRHWRWSLHIYIKIELNARTVQSEWRKFKSAKWSEIIKKSFMVGDHRVGSVGRPETQVFYVLA